MAVQAGGALPALSGAALTSLNGSAVQSGTIGGSTAISTSGNIQTSGAITSNLAYLYEPPASGYDFDRVPDSHYRTFFLCINVACWFGRSWSDINYERCWRFVLDNAFDYRHADGFGFRRSFGFLPGSYGGHGRWISGRRSWYRHRGGE